MERSRLLRAKSEPSLARQVVVGECRQPHVVDPFQYYAEKGERIVTIELFSHADIAQATVHFDKDGNAIARLGGNGDLDELEPPADTIAFGDEVFDYLMRAFHLASIGSNQLWDPREVQAAIEATKGKPVIIGGCGRSGTTLLLSILGSHPSIFAFPEEMYPFFPYPFRLQRLLRELSKNKMNQRTRWAEKTPKNVRAFGPILTAFSEEVRLIHIVRDGRDVVTSHHPNHAQQYWVSPERWVADVREGLKYEDRTLLLRYEDLVQEPAKTLQQVCDYIGEPFDERMLHPEEHSTVKTNVAWDGRDLKALHRSSIGRWKEKKNTDRIRVFAETPGAKELMDQLGY